MSNQWIYHRWTPLKLWRQWKLDEWKQDAPELNFPVCVITRGFSHDVMMRNSV